METNKNPMREPKEKRVPRSRDEQPIYFCTDCGSDDVEVSVWYNPNTDRITGECLEDAYCRSCGSETIDARVRVRD